MKFILAWLVFGALACSSDKEDGAEDRASLVGHWNATAIVLDEGAGVEAMYAQQVLALLLAESCSVLQLDFNEDGTGSLRNATPYLEIDVSGTGIDMACPEQSDSDGFAYVYSDNELTLTDTDNGTVTLEAILDKDTLTLDATKLDIPDFNLAGRLVFERQ